MTQIQFKITSITGYDQCYKIIPTAMLILRSTNLIYAISQTTAAPIHISFYNQVITHVPLKNSQCPLLL